MKVVRDINDTPFAPKMLFNEERTEAQQETETITMGKNTQRLWRVAKDRITIEDPPYIQDHGSDDEAVLFLILSRYINDYEQLEW